MVVKSSQFDGNWHISIFHQRMEPDHFPLKEYSSDTLHIIEGTDQPSEKRLSLLHPPWCRRGEMVGGHRPSPFRGKSDRRNSGGQHLKRSSELFGEKERPDVYSHFLKHPHHFSHTDPALWKTGWDPHSEINRGYVPCRKRRLRGWNLHSKWRWTGKIGKKF